MSAGGSGLVSGRARVVPGTTSNQVGGGFTSSSGGSTHANNLGADARALTETWLVAMSASDGGPVTEGSVRLEQPLPNWTRHVMYDAGSMQGAAAELPPVLEVPVWIDGATRQVVALDVEAAITELTPHREIGVREWKGTDAPLAGVRQAADLAKSAGRGLPGFFRGLRRSAKELRDDLRDDEPDPAAGAPDAATARARQSYAASPAQRAQARASVLANGPTMAQAVAAGTHSATGFAGWLEFQEGSGILSADEAEALRQTAGLPAKGV